MSNNLSRARLYLSKPKAEKAVRGIFAVMDTGRFLSREFFVQRFREAGYVQRLAEQRADWLIALNTDIDHWSRFRVKGTQGKETYGWHPEKLRLHWLLSQDNQVADKG